MKRCKFRFRVESHSKRRRKTLLKISKLNFFTYIFSSLMSVFCSGKFPVLRCSKLENKHGICKYEAKLNAEEGLGIYYSENWLYYWIFYSIKCEWFVHLLYGTTFSPPAQLIILHSLNCSISYVVYRSINRLIRPIERIPEIRNLRIQIDRICEMEKKMHKRHEKSNCESSLMGETTLPHKQETKSNTHSWRWQERWFYETSDSLYYVSNMLLTQVNIRRSLLRVWFRWWENPLAWESKRWKRKSFYHIFQFEFCGNFNILSLNCEIMILKFLHGKT